MRNNKIRGYVDPKQARETSLELLDIQRRRVAEHRKNGEQLDRTGKYVIEGARLYGMSWVDIAQTLGMSVWAARRITLRRPR